MELTVKETVLKATNRLQDAGVGSPKLDAEVLLCHLLQKEKTYLIVNSAMTLDDTIQTAYFTMVEKRAEGKPIQYITGRKEFMGLSLHVDERVLIPRADTETMVEHAIENLNDKKHGLGGPTVLDLCCGSGAIAVSIAYFVPKAKITAADISGEALELAKINAKENKVKKQIKFVEGDLFEAVKRKEQFDLIITNPPYIKTETITELQREIKNYEPRLALDGGSDGLAFYRRIVPQAAAHLKKNGSLYMEIGYDQGDAVLAMMRDSGLYQDVEILQDLAGFDRIVKANKF